MEGISIIICCYNSAWIIDKCLKALKSQNIASNIPWEIIIIDNCCKDETTLIAKKTLEKTNISYKIIFEEKPGLRYAREKGIKSANYDFLLFVDDDNILDENYVEQIYKFIKEDSKIGAFGGRGIPNFGDTLEPEWFKQHGSKYALYSQLNNQKKVRGNFLYGAGCCYRKSALLDIQNKGIEQTLTGRTGKSLTSGEDSELSKLLILNGYTLGASDQLTFQHVLTQKRLTKEYLKKLYYAIGQSGSYLRVYDCIINKHNFFSIQYILRYIKMRLFVCFISIFQLNKYEMLLEYAKGYIDSINENGFNYYFNLYSKIKNAYKY